VPFHDSDGRGVIKMADLFMHFPVALLVRQ
jgi:hypothetical protein